MKFINENSIEGIIKYIEEKQLNINDVIAKSMAARTEFGLKVQELIEKLSGKNRY